MEGTERHLEELSTSVDTEPIQSAEQTDETQLLLPDKAHFIQIACWNCTSSNRLLCSIGFLPISFAMLILASLFIKYVYKQGVCIRRIGRKKGSKEE